MKKRMLFDGFDGMFDRVDDDFANDDFAFDLIVKPTKRGKDRNEDFQQRQRYKNLSRDALAEIVDKYR